MRLKKLCKRKDLNVALHGLYAAHAAVAAAQASYFILILMLSFSTKTSAMYTFFIQNGDGQLESKGNGIFLILWKTMER
ncbi:hypothetical protein kam1_1680 [Methylacidiphilum kamchatkense Kam1]|uniref:Uncharacterized protein n=1 Tax=Methylacidiphilum kamchatkense Kam1 TaxID=1202785 RepID=A0A516TNV9_9BACT|nr:hypothetical protein kam1_1680 [Methylacidiphilum kamchatkense Kam1]